MKSLMVLAAGAASGADGEADGEGGAEVEGATAADPEADPEAAVDRVAEVGALDAVAELTDEAAGWAGGLWAEPLQAPTVRVPQPTGRTIVARRAGAVLTVDSKWVSAAEGCRVPGTTLPEDGRL